MTDDNTVMAIGLLFAVLATLCGAGVNRALGAHWSVAPFSGLAAVAVLTSWCARLGAPPAVSTGLVIAGALVGAGVIVRAALGGGTTTWSGCGGNRTILGDRVTVAVLCAAVLLPWVLLGTALAGVDAPVSTHDGAFHVELIDNLRRGVQPQGWYPMGFHSAVAAVLELAPWLDTARGTVEAAQALSVLAPLGVFALGLSLGASPRIASLGALIQALTYIYPYDNQMWAGWPLGTSILLLLGLWSVGARWIAEPRVGLALLTGLLAGAIVLTHGTEVYSSIVGLAVIAGLRWRHIRWRQLAVQAPLALVAAAVCATPYVATLAGWAAGGGATAAGAQALDDISAEGQSLGSGSDWLEFMLGITGAASLIDLPLRAVLLLLGARQKRLRAAFVAWLTFGAILFAASFLDIQPVRRLYVLTFPWLVHHRPPQMVVLFASLLVGAGLFVTVRWFWALRPRLVPYPGVWRRVAIVGAAALLFFAEGSAVSIFKTVQQVIFEQNVYSTDDQAAMSWLRNNAAAGSIVINDGSADAGIWAPYKAGLAVLLPRSAAGPLQAARAPIAASLASLQSSPSVVAAACALKADYVYVGSRTVEGDPRAIPDRDEMQATWGLREVFVSGGAAVFRIDLPCAN